MVDGDGGGDEAASTTTGSMKLSEVGTGHDGDDILFEAGSGPPDVGATVIKALKPALVEALAAYAAALDEVEL